MRAITLIRHVLVIPAIVALLGWSQVALAFEKYLVSFRSTYSGVAGTRLDTCSLCHDNAYKTAYAAAGHKFVPIEPKDSDGDGYTNLTEITARTFPGDAGDTPTDLLFYDNFSNAGTSVPNWRVTNAAGSAGRLATSSTLPARALVNIGLASAVPEGRIAAKVGLTTTAAATPNAGFLLWYRGVKDYVSVKLTPSSVSILEKAAGVITKLGSAPAGIGTTLFRNIQVDFHASGLVEVSMNGKPIVSGTALAAGPGKVGIYATKSRALFDNFRLLNGTVLGP